MMSLAEALLALNPMPVSSYIASEYPNTVRALRLIDQDNTLPKRRKGFNLVKRENKRLGYVYYVRYSHEGKMLPSKWNTHTNNRNEAERFARENKNRLVERYLRAHDTKMYGLLEQFYEPQSKFLFSEEKRNRRLSDRNRNEYRAVITGKFAPFLKERNITGFDQITALTLSDFQDTLLARGIKPQTVNNNLKPVKRILAYLVRKNIIAENPADHLRSISVRQNDRTARGCYELEKLKGVFNRKWKDGEAYLLCLLIYTTGMRNSEIARLSLEDVIGINGCRFISVKESKTESGIRLVPLHDFVYRKLKAYAAGKGSKTLLFDIYNSHFNKANNALARRLKVSDEALEKEHITFYSGRHFWKTLMSSEGLGEDIEEMFMGHKVSGNVAKLYNHRDKQGKKLMVKKARQVFAILDRRLFR